MGQCLKKSQTEAKATEVNIWLNDNGLGEYSEKFKEKGWDEISLLLDMTDIQIEMCIQKPGHVVKFKRALDNLTRSLGRPKRPGNFYNDEPRPGPSQTDSNLDETSYANMRQKHLHSDQSNSSVDSLKENDRNYAKTGKESAIVNYSNDQGDGSRTCQSLGEEDNYPSYPLSEVTAGSKYTTAGSSISDDSSAEAPFRKRNNSPSVSTADGGQQKSRLESNQPKSSFSSESSSFREKTDSDSSFTDALAYDEIQVESEKIVKWYEKKDYLFVETEAYSELKCIVDEIHWAMLLGKSGDGKSVTAAHLMLQYRDKGFEPMYISTAEQWKTTMNKRKDGAIKHFVIIDDIFGGCIVDKHKTDQWMVLFDEMVKTIKASAGSLVVVCTSRRYVFSDVEADLENFKFFDEYFVVDMTTEKFQLAANEKVEIFEKYATEYDIPDGEKIDVRNIDPPHGFPHCVEMYCTNEALRQNKGAAFFDDSLTCVKEEILGFKDNDTLKYVLLLLVLLKNNHLEKNYFQSLKDSATADDRKIFKDNYIDIEIDTQTLLPDIYNALDDLGHAYLVHGPDGSCCFSHESLLETVAYLYLSINPSHAIDILDFSYILAFINDGRVKTASLKDTNRVTIRHLPAGSAQALAKRITQELKLGNMTAVGYCNAWRDQSFVKEWINYVTTTADNVADLAQVLAVQTGSTHV